MTEKDSVRIEMAERTVAKTLRNLGYGRDDMDEIRTDSMSRLTRLTKETMQNNPVEGTVCCLLSATAERLARDGIRLIFAIRKDDISVSVA